MAGPVSDHSGGAGPSVAHPVSGAELRAVAPADAGPHFFIGSSWQEKSGGLGGVTVAKSR